MKVTIKDKDALVSIRKDDLEKYLIENEWDKEEDIVRDDVVIGSKWKLYNTVKHMWYYVSLVNEDIIDYSARMSENLMAIEQATDRSQIEIYCEITQEIMIFGPEDKLIEHFGV